MTELQKGILNKISKLNRCYLLQMHLFYVSRRHKIESQAKCFLANFEVWGRQNSQNIHYKFLYSKILHQVILYQGMLSSVNVISIRTPSRPVLSLKRRWSQDSRWSQYSERHASSRL